MIFNVQVLWKTIIPSACNEIGVNHQPGPHQPVPHKPVTVIEGPGCSVSPN